jgi:cell division septation protein DedD
MTEWERPSLSSGGRSATKSRSKKPHRLRWVVAVAAVAATTGFGWVSWSAYKSGGTNGDGIVPFLKADTDPTRIRPDNPGGMPVPNQDKAIYDKLDPKRAPPKGVERLLPPPEAPVSRPAAASQPRQAPAIPSLSETTQPTAREVGAPAVKAPQEEAEAAAPSRAAETPSPFTKLEAPPAAPKSAPAPQVAAVPSSAPAAPPKPPVTGGVRVQLGAVGSEEAAQREWERIRRVNSDILGGMSPAIVRADLGAKGVVYRIQAGPVADADAAADLCAKLKTRNVGCFLAR